MKSLRIWLLYAKNSFLQTLSNRIFFGMFLFGKSVRVVMFFGFLYYLLDTTKGLGGYSKDQILFFYLSFNLVDSAAQFLFREVYRFRDLVVTGDLDLVLVKPINPLLRLLLGGTDLLDCIFLVIMTGAVIYLGGHQGLLSVTGWLLYFILIINALVIAAAFHIFILSMGILTTSIDHLVQVYRDLASMVRIPVDIYTEPLRGILTFVIPLGIMMTFPPKALMGILSWPLIFISFGLSLTFCFLSLWLWKRSLKEYQSASS
jgi:ABC-2 type transport system permease protein